MHLLRHRGTLLLPPIVLAVGVLALTFGLGLRTTESATETGSPYQTSLSFKDEKLAAPLVALADAEAAGASHPKSVADAVAARQMRFNDEGAVQVFIAIEGADAILGLDALGITIERVDYDLGVAQAQVPVGKLRAVAGLPAVQSVRLPDYAFSNAGSIITEGDATMKSDQLRSELGVDGTGVTVGVISDGVGGLATSQALGDLPDVDTTTCNVHGGDPGAEGAEGTAMLEIVHDVAPGAELMFGNFGFATVFDFNDAVDCLAANADIVVDDIGFFGVGPYDGTSFVSANTSDALNGPGPIRGYFNAVGNQAQVHYQEPYVASGTELTGSDIANFEIPASETWILHEFDETSDTEHAGQVAAPTDGNRVILPSGHTMTIVLVWDDPWGGAPNDYDVFVREGSAVGICAGDPQSGSGAHQPVEICAWSNPSGVDVPLEILIGNYLGEAGPVEFDMFLLCGFCPGLGNGNRLDFNTEGSSVSNQSDAGGSPAAVISMGAVDLDDLSSIRPYSSHGTTEDDRMKPDIVTADGVCITGSGGFGQGSCQESGSRFFGTSAAAPHAAAVAALLLECDPAISRVELYDRMTGTAIDLGAPGPDNVFGHGRLNALAAAGECAGAPAATATPPPTATPTATEPAGSTATPTITPTVDGTPLATPTPSTTPPAASPTPTPTATFTPVNTATNTATATNTPVPLLSGDANCDGIVNALDAALILQHSAGLLGALACPEEADANEDSVRNAVDATLVLQLIAGLLASLPV